MGDKETDDIQRIDPSRPTIHPLWTKYGYLGGNGIPLILVFEGDKLIEHKSGFVSDTEFLRMLGK